MTNYTLLMIGFVPKPNLRQISLFAKGSNMKQILTPATLKVVLLPLVGAVGAVVAMTWPMGHKAFCSGLSGLVL